ncbi:hypothetical protein H072_8197 [Dactylellina haptotyla CBS 200.50]|uniref:Uncharacterized protein n=1 Tax=Dactylellina haptotyla (strain CBS 200.50) TaxID=1284197 RepID=S8A5I9_DACHA|nr:hypothetical protein H072_8197 [Dactylellina haptotyla CBS 200.50]
MNFLKTSMSNAEQNTVPEADSPQFKNAQAIEEDAGSPVSPTFETRQTSGDPQFKYDMFGTERPDGETQDHQEPVPTATRDRRMSKEWDASKVPPSRFQKRAGSIHATPASRDGHVDRNSRLAIFEKLTSKGSKGERRKSQS